jgi:hypothetical protein
MSNPAVFLSLPCLTEKSNPFSASDLAKKWFKGSDKRYIDRTIQDFIRLNSPLFNFIGVTPIVSGSYNDLELFFRSENYIGAIPLKSPVNGKPFADFVIYPRYLQGSSDNANEYVEIIYLLEKDIKPDFYDSNDLLTLNHVRPPIYYECIKFIDLFFLAMKRQWVKFDSKEEEFKNPKGMVNWNKYLEREWDPFHKLDFPCRINWLNKFHDGIKELLFVYKLSREIIFDRNTPIRLKVQVRNKLNILDRLLSGYQPLEVESIVIRNSDPAIIKQTKAQANRILLNKNSSSKAWRVDFSVIFEKYVQYLFTQVSNKVGWATKSNSKFENASRNTPLWGLKFLEPDLLLFKGNNCITIDAKYKSHFLNLESKSEYLKNEHRSDLHQITAYCAFQSSEHKLGFLCYPANSINSKRLVYKSNISTNDVVIYLLGIPITSSGLHEVQKEIEKKFFDIVRIEKLRI